MRSTRHPHVTRRPDGRSPRAVVIGGGLAGLASAGLLARDGYEVDLVEALDRVGGRVDCLEVDGYRFDTGPTWYLMGEVMEHFFALMGADVRDHLDLVRLQPAYRLYAPDGTCLDVPSGVDAVAALFESREAGAGRAVRDHLASARRTYRLALDNFLYTTFSSPLAWLNRDVLTGLPGLGRLLTESMERQAGRVVGDPVLRQMLTFHAVFLSAAPSMLPSMYHLMTHLDLGDGVDHPRGGMRSLVTAVEEVVRAVGVRIHTSTRAEAVLTRPGGRGRTRATVTGVRVRAADGATRDLPADVVVSGADMWATETRMLPRELQTYPEAAWEKTCNGIGTVLGMLGVEGDLGGLAHHSFFFTEDWAGNFAQIFGPEPRVPDPASVYACRATATEPSAAPPGCETLFILVPVPADERIGHGSAGRELARGVGVSGGSHRAADGAGSGSAGHGEPRGDDAVEATVDRALAQVAAWAGIPDLPSRVRVRRTLGPADHTSLYGSYHGNALGPAHVLRQSAFLRPRSASAHVDGLVYAGQTTAPGIGVPMALISAENVLKRVHGDSTATPVPEPDDAPRHSRLHASALAGQARAVRLSALADTLLAPTAVGVLRTGRD